MQPVKRCIRDDSGCSRVNLSVRQRVHVCFSATAECAHFVTTKQGVTLLIRGVCMCVSAWEGVHSNIWPLKVAQKRLIRLFFLKGKDGAVG